MTKMSDVFVLPFPPNAFGESDTKKAAAHAVNCHDDLVEALEEGRRAIGDHIVPDHCYATGPMTGNDFRDLVECPACSFILKYDRALAKARGKG